MSAGKVTREKENKDHNIYYSSCKVWLLPDDYKIIWKTFSNKLNKSFRGLLASCWSSPPSPGSVCVCVHWRVYYRVRVRVLVRWTTCTAPRVWNGWPGGCQNDLWLCLWLWRHKPVVVGDGGGDGGVEAPISSILGKRGLAEVEPGQAESLTWKGLLVSNNQIILLGCKIDLPCTWKKKRIYQVLKVPL